MFIVAVAELGEPTHLDQVAFDLGVMLYDLKLALQGGFPAVVVATAEQSKALEARDSLERHGSRAVVLDRTRIVPSRAMAEFKDFCFDDEGLTADAISGAFCPYRDITALLRATHRTSTVSTETVKERKLRPGMAIATGGLIMSKTSKREITKRVDSQQQVLYVFRAGGAAPFILRERNARYRALGPELRPTSLENFMTSVRILRERAPGAAYDERLIKSRPIRGVAEGIEATDILAYLLEASLLG